MFLDHFGCIFMSHRPVKEMFSKTAFVISTTAGIGTRNVIKTIQKNLKYWGIPKIYKCGLTLRAKDWDDMPSKKQNKYKKILEKKII